MSDSEYLKELAPLPWKSKKIRSRLGLYRLRDAQDLTVLLIPGKAGTGTGDRAKEIAEYVLHAANSHEELLAATHLALNALADGFERRSVDFFAVRDSVEAAISKAERGES